jgi:hypothetical protein
MSDYPPKKSLVREVTMKDFQKNVSKAAYDRMVMLARIGDEIWEYNDHEVHLAGSAGYVLMRQGSPIECFLIKKF